MSIAVILLVTAAVSLVLSWVFGGRILSRRHRSVLAWISVVVVVLGILLIFISSNGFKHISVEHTWPVTEGKVVDSEIAKDITMRPEIAYTYTVKGITYTDTTAFDAPGFGGKFKRYDVARTITREHPVGSRVRVHYNPSDPRISALKVEVTWDIYMKLAFGVTLYAIGIFLAVGLIFGRRRGLQPPLQTV